MADVSAGPLRDRLSGPLHGYASRWPTEIHTLRAALNAVLDLHKVYRRRPDGAPYCDECDDSEGFLVPYPCPTVLAIAREIGADTC